MLHLSLSPPRVVAVGVGVASTVTATNTSNTPTTTNQQKLTNDTNTTIVTNAIKTIVTQTTSSQLNSTQQQSPTPAVTVTARSPITTTPATSAASRNHRHDDTSKLLLLQHVLATKSALSSSSSTSGSTNAHSVSKNKSGKVAPTPPSIYEAGNMIRCFMELPQDLKDVYDELLYERSHGVMWIGEEDQQQARWMDSSLTNTVVEDDTSTSPSRATPSAIQTRSPSPFHTYHNTHVTDPLAHAIPKKSYISGLGDSGMVTLFADLERVDLQPPPSAVIGLVQRAERAKELAAKEEEDALHRTSQENLQLFGDAPEMMKLREELLRIEHENRKAEVDFQQRQIDARQAEDAEQARVEEVRQAAFGLAPATPPSTTTQTKPKPIIPFYLQGELDHYSHASVEKRISIKYSHDFVQKVHKFWLTFEGLEPRGGGRRQQQQQQQQYVAPRTSFVKMMILIYAYLHQEDPITTTTQSTQTPAAPAAAASSLQPGVVGPSSSSSPSSPTSHLDLVELHRALTKDLSIDLPGRTISFVQFHESMFQIIDLWTITIDQVEYIQLMEEIYQAITRPRTQEEIRMRKRQYDTPSPTRAALAVAAGRSPLVKSPAASRGQSAHPVGARWPLVPTSTPLTPSEEVETELARRRLERKNGTTPTIEIASDEDGSDNDDDGDDDPAFESGERRFEMLDGPISPKEATFSERMARRAERLAALELSLPTSTTGSTFGSSVSSPIGTDHFAMFSEVTNLTTPRVRMMMPTVSSPNGWLRRRMKDLQSSNTNDEDVGGEDGQSPLLLSPTTTTPSSPRSLYDDEIQQEEASRHMTRNGSIQSIRTDDARSEQVIKDGSTKSPHTTTTRTSKRKGPGWKLSRINKVDERMKEVTKETKQGDPSSSARKGRKSLIDVVSSDTPPNSGSTPSALRSRRPSYLLHGPDLVEYDPLHVRSNDVHGDGIRNRLRLLAKLPRPSSSSLHGEEDSSHEGGRSPTRTISRTNNHTPVSTNTTIQHTYPPLSSRLLPFDPFRASTKGTRDEPRSLNERQKLLDEVRTSLMKDAMAVETQRSYGVVIKVGSSQIQMGEQREKSKHNDKQYRTDGGNDHHDDDDGDGEMNVMTTTITNDERTMDEQSNTSHIDATYQPYIPFPPTSPSIAYKDLMFPLDPSLSPRPSSHPLINYSLNWSRTPVGARSIALSAAISSSSSPSSSSSSSASDTIFRNCMFQKVSRSVRERMERKERLSHKDDHKEETHRRIHSPTKVLGLIPEDYYHLGRNNNRFEFNTSTRSHTNTSHHHPHPHPPPPSIIQLLVSHGSTRMKTLPCDSIRTPTPSSTHRHSEDHARLFQPTRIDPTIHFPITPHAPNTPRPTIPSQAHATITPSCESISRPATAPSLSMTYPTTSPIRPFTPSNPAWRPRVNTSLNDTPRVLRREHVHGRCMVSGTIHTPPPMSLSNLTRRRHETRVATHPTEEFSTTLQSSKWNGLEEERKEEERRRRGRQRRMEYQPTTTTSAVDHDEEVPPDR